jgi:membrane-associated phospholipid phosphatase
LYWSRTGNRIHCFLATLFLGTLCAYALLRHFPTASPRVAFQKDGLPNYSGFFRAANIWVLSRFDISSSVFPSGHVAVAFNSAFGLSRAVPERRWLWV